MGPSNRKIVRHIARCLFKGFTPADKYDRNILSKYVLFFHYRYDSKAMK